MSWVENFLKINKWGGEEEGGEGATAIRDLRVSIKYQLSIS